MRLSNRLTHALLAFVALGHELYAGTATMEDAVMPNRPRHSQNEKGGRTGGGRGLYQSRVAKRRVKFNDYTKLLPIPSNGSKLGAHVHARGQGEGRIPHSRATHLKCS